MSPGLDPARSFARLVVGGANQLAVAAGRALAEGARPPFNPLFIMGGPGQGKTHLLHAIGGLRAAIEPSAAIRYATWPELGDGLRAARLEGRPAEFLQPFQDAGLLLVDDGERLTAWPEERGALLSLLEARLDRGLATVLAADRPPGALVGPDDPAAQVLGGGLVVELGPPDPALREAVIRRLMGEAAVSFSAAVVQEVVGLALESIRDVAAAASRLIAFQSVSATPLDPSQARVLITGVSADRAGEDEPPPAGFVEPAPAVRVAPPPSSAPTPTALSLQPPARLVPLSPGPVPEEADEFGSFLSDVVAGISRQVDSWRAKVGDAILRWEGEGIHTARLQGLLDQEFPAQPEAVLQRFEQDVVALRQMAAEIRTLAPDLAVNDALRDPDQLPLAARLLEEARTWGLTSHPVADHLRLDQLVEGASNRPALQAVRDVLAAPGRGANPLLIVGDSGVGKTHLLHALGNGLVGSGLTGVVYLAAPTLGHEVDEAIHGGRLSEWLRRYRWAGALLLDDVHRLGGQGAVQDALLELLDRLLPEGRQVVATSALPPADLTGLAPQLLTRLAAGLVVDLPRPDREVRAGVIRGLLAGTAAAGDTALVDYLARRPAESVRAVQAMVQRVLRAAAERGEEGGGGGAPSQALARLVLETATARALRAAVVRPGVLGPTVGGHRLREKLIEEWPEVRDRLVEEMG